MVTATAPARHLPLSLSLSLSLSLRLSPSLSFDGELTSNVKGCTVSFTAGPGKRCSEATNKRPYAGVTTSSGAAFNSITPTLCLNKGSAIATALPLISQGPGMRGKQRWRGAIGYWQEVWAVAFAKARLCVGNGSLSARGATV